MSEETTRSDFSLLEMVAEVIQGKRGGNINEVVSLLALSNILGILTFLNSQDLKAGIKTSSSKTGSSDIKDMASTLLTMLGNSPDKKINPAALLNLVKTLSSSEGQPAESKETKGGGEKGKNT
ncbi:MAG: hypothetical protein PWP45_896 [Tepidanaerobacteraceae bacterium]|nr:hypothetical protein [Tepidanaerobacteraceae bacterium]